MSKNIKVFILDKVSLWLNNKNPSITITFLFSPFTELSFLFLEHCLHFILFLCIFKSKSARKDSQFIAWGHSQFLNFLLKIGFWNRKNLSIVVLSTDKYFDNVAARK
eukprot:TRINITY_DN3528_c0_g1_i1.p1 TRINITY_DN3528_c0_g1~~TRINITY_DN3528_c0_g1_i1.p1  ORF type:complete len:107 (+),score=5.71 TRINITY_DN3528_c0_g1_i1:364-684(+)